MKKISMIIGAVAACFILASCGEKCTTCSYTYTDSAGETQTASWPEFCGSNAEVTLYKEGVQATGELEVSGLGGTGVTTSCVDD